ncbi:RNA polymerase sporulation sigma factor SigH [uncultured Robinsoniella sp.]|uniref:RNA polymerase sporulation sigma factor SigH n=1 Tax=uncultured Robinsoniella sp. TaxID=904190 RepID=UPI00374F788B
MVSYDGYTDEELIVKLKDGNPEITDYIMEKYKYLVRKEARALYLIGGDKDDLIQEGMIGLFKAVRDYREDRDASFYHFAKLCIGRQLYHAIEASNRKKHTPLNSYVSLYSGTMEGGEESLPLEEILFTQESNPEELLIHEENKKQIEEKLEASLSAFEKKVLDYYLLGKDYVEIGELLGKPPKSIDNALQRIRKKIR